MLINNIFFKKINRIFINKRLLSTMNIVNITQTIREVIPALDNNRHKGQAGRIGIVGGSLEYTGAPYFAGISALKVGADLVHIFCTASAGTVIKSYSPELIVHPLLHEENAHEQILQWLDRLHVVVIGPGLGRESHTMDIVTELIHTIRNKKIPLVIDADGLHLVTENPQIITDFQSPVILTPNRIEFERLVKKVNGVESLFELGKNIILLKKGFEDELISSCQNIQWKGGSGGSSRRCGGQGDLLSGAIATFLHWGLEYSNKIDIVSENKDLAAASLSCYAASVLIRKCNEKAFKDKGRSMLASDMIEYIHQSFEELFGV